LSTSSSESELKAVPVSSLGEADRETLSEIAATLANTYKGGCLYFGVCNSARKISLLENALGQLLAPKGITASRVVLAERNYSAEPPCTLVHVSEPLHIANKQIRATLRMAPCWCLTILAYMTRCGCSGAFKLFLQSFQVIL
jgi:hypothetical protein